MGASQSNQNNSTVQNHGHGITVVRAHPDVSDALVPRVNLPPRVPPILSLDGHMNLNQHPARFQIDSQLWMDFLAKIDGFMNSRDELVVNRQNILQKKIILADEHVQRFTDSYINDKHKTLAKMKDEFRKSTEIEESIDKCMTQAQICIDMLNKLNFLLPDEHKLEPLED